MGFTRPLLVILLVFGGWSHAATIEQKTQAMRDQWETRFREEGLRCVSAEPFVIAGDGTAQQLAAYRDQTILAAAKALWATYFDKRPTEPILILLFESEAPYKRLSKKWFHDGNVPHFGYYRQRDRVMVMNVATGTGTLVHELTHALISPDFPRVPAWFNEGLASLYEQCTLSATSIRGLVNWRLAALRQAIRDNKLRPLDELIADPGFYSPERSGLNYAEARYFMLYLQEHQLLVDYYRQFRDHATQDPTGIETLRKLIAPKTMEQFEGEWRAWVLRLGD
jgi:hypothetical protein